MADLTLNLSLTREAIEHADVDAKKKLRAQRRWPSYFCPPSQEGFHFDDPFPNSMRETHIDGAFTFLVSEEGLIYLTDLWWGPDWERFEFSPANSRGPYRDLLALVSCRSYDIWVRFTKSNLWLPKHCPIERLIKSGELKDMKGPFPDWVILYCENVINPKLLMTDLLRKDVKMIESICKRCMWKHKSEWWVMFGADSEKSQRETDDPKNTDTCKSVFQKLQTRVTSWKCCNYHQIRGCDDCTKWFPAPGGAVACSLCELMIDKKLWRGTDKGKESLWCGRWDCSGQ